MANGIFKLFKGTKTQFKDKKNSGISEGNLIMAKDDSSLTGDLYIDFDDSHRVTVADSNMVIDFHYDSETGKLQGKSLNSTAKDIITVESSLNGDSKNPIQNGVVANQISGLNGQLLAQNARVVNNAANISTLRTDLNAEVVNRQTLSNTTNAKFSALNNYTRTENGSSVNYNDEGKAIRQIAGEELAYQLIPSSAQAGLDTLKEISTWIQSHPGEAAAMNANIEGLKNGTVKAGYATKVDNDSSNRNIVNTYETKSDATTKLNTAKTYADTLQKNQLAGTKAITSGSNTDKIWYVCYWEVSDAWYGVGTNWSIVDSEASFNAILGTKFRNQSTAETTSAGNVQWLAASKTPPKAVITKQLSEDKTTAVYRLYIYYPSTWHTLTITPLHQTVAGTVPTNIVNEQVDTVLGAEQWSSNQVKVDYATTAYKDNLGRIIDSTYETKSDANAKLTEAKNYTNALQSNIQSGAIVAGGAGYANMASKDTNGNIIVDTYETKVEANTKLTQAKDYTDQLASVIMGRLTAAEKYTATYGETDISRLQSNYFGYGKTLLLETFELVPGVYNADNGVLLDTWEDMISKWLWATSYTGIEDSSIIPPDNPLSTLYGFTYLNLIVVVPDYVTDIGNYALWHYHGNKCDIILTSPLTSIGGSAIYSAEYIYCAFPSSEYTIPTNAYSLGWATVTYDYDLSTSPLNFTKICPLISATENNFVFKGSTSEGDVEYVCDATMGWFKRNVPVVRVGDALIKYDYSNERIVFAFD